MTVQRAWPVLVTISASVVLELIVIADLLSTRPYDPWSARACGLAVLLLIAALAWNDRSKLAFHLPRFGRAALALEVGGVAGLVASFLWLSWIDLRSWFFGVIGDEYDFYDASREMATGSIRDLFSQRGTYGIIPFLSSYVEGMQMRLFGLDLVGWKFSIITQVAIALIVTYLLARDLFGRRVAMLTLGFLATSHYLLGYTHTGYANIETLLPTVAAFRLFSVGYRRKSLALLVAAGVCAGLGWYTFYSSRTAIVILAITTALTMPPRRWLALGLPVLGGFAMLFLPLLAVNKAEVITIMLDESRQSGTAEVAANRALLPYWNIGRSLLAFNYNPHNGPFVWGSLLEPTTAILFVLGLAYAGATWRDNRSRFLLTWFIIGIVATGRRFLNIMNPVATAGVVALISLSTYGNLHRWFVEMPANVPSTPDTMVLLFIVSPRCQSAPRVPLIVDENTRGELVQGLKARSRSLVIPEFVTYTAPLNWLETADLRCVFFRLPRQDLAISLAKNVSERWPAADTAYVVDGSGQTYLRIFYPRSGN